jgi:UDP-N-acetylglucosamine diphosphorylase/glucosamine-1-phosphate N-acetyltransferase
MGDPMNLVLFDDAQARRWEPFAVTRSVAHLWFGALRMADRASTGIGLPIQSILTSPILEGLPARDLPPCRPWSDSPDRGSRVFLSSRVVLPTTGVPALPDQGVLRVGGAVVGWVLPDGGPNPEPEDLLNPERWLPAGPAVDLPGTLLQWPWDLMERNGEQLRSDLAVLFRNRSYSALSGRAHIIGDGAVTLGSGVEVEPGVVLDTREGHIHLGDQVTVRAFTRLAGPLFVASGSTLLGGDIGAATIGTTCKIRGEVSDTIIGDYVNKAHDGHLGHAVVGNWVNFGAGTTNSDLKNTYGAVRVRMGDEDVDTGLIKFGSLIGDHVKTGIGTLLPTGCLIGAGSNVFGGGIAPRATPPFAWMGPAGLDRYDLERFLTNTAKAMDRRNKVMKDGERTVLRRAWEESQKG